MKEYINMIVEHGKKEDMDCLSNMLVELMYELKESNHDEYEEYKKKIIGMAYDHKITKELAKEIVEDMKPKGEYWSMDDIRGVVGELPNLPDVYVVMNSLVNDYGEVISPEEVEKYVAMTNAWINDVDGHKNKTWWYFVNE